MTDSERVEAVRAILWSAVRNNRAGVGDRQSILRALAALDDPGVITFNLTTEYDRALGTRPE